MKRRDFMFTAAVLSFAEALAPAGIAAGADVKTLRVGINRPISSLDPSGRNVDPVLVAFDPLTTLDAHDQLAPALALSWTRKSDLVWTFTLRGDVKFSDGSPFTAHEVVRYISLITAPESKFTSAGEWRQVISGAEATSDLTVDLHTPTPNLGLPDRLATLTIGKFIEGETDLAKRFIGTGPYVLQKIDLDSGGKAQRNPHYTGPETAFDEIEFVILATEEARLLALQAREIDLLTQIDPRTVKQLAGNSHYHTGAKASSWNLVLRIKEKRPGSQLTDVRVRQALNYAVDKQALIDGVFGGGAAPSPGQFLIEGWDCTNPALKAFPYDPDKARKLLADAGFANGLRLRLDVPNGSYLAVNTVVQILTAQFAAVGVQIDIRTLPFPAWVDLTGNKNEGDLIYIGHNIPYRYTPERLRQFKSNNWQSHWDDPVYDAAADRALTAQTPEAQQAAIDEATAIFHDNPHTVFLFPQPITWAVRADINWEPRSDQRILPQFAVTKPLER